MRIIAISASLIGLLLASIWVIKSPDWDSMFALAAAITALASSFFLKRDNSAPSQSQNISGSSVGIQAGRDVRAKDIK